MKTAAEKFRRLLQADQRYDAEAYNFVYEALDFTLKNLVKECRRGQPHVSGQELLQGIRQHAIDQFGCLAGTVFATWGLHGTEDFGEIVFNLVEFDLMGKQESDTKEDFRNVYDFSEVFDVSPVFAYSPEEDTWTAAYITRSHLTASRSAVSAPARGGRNSKP